MAQYLWGYNHWRRIEMLRGLVTYFDENGVTTQDKLRAWASTADFERDVKGRVKWFGPIIFRWLVMRQGVDTVKPDIWVHRYIEEAIGYSLSNKEAVQTVERAAREMGLKAYELDLRIWEYQRSRG